MKKILGTMTVLAALVLTGCTSDFEPVRSDRNDILEFRVLTENSGTYSDPSDPEIQLPNFYKDAEGVIEEDKIIVLAPYYAHTWSGLKPSFTHSDRAMVFIGSDIQDSGTTAADFTAPVTYTAFSEKNESKTYTVEFYKEKPFYGYSVLQEDNPGLPYDADVLIDSLSRSITVELPTETSLERLIPRFTVPDGIAVTVGGAQQESGLSVVDFTSPVVYTLSLSDAYPETWTVTGVLHEPSSENDFLNFNFSTTRNPELFADLTGEVDPLSHTVRVASYWTADTDPLVLIPDFTTSDYVRSVVCNGTEQVSGSTAVDFARTVTYTITADDGGTQEWRVTFYKPTKFYIRDRYFRQLLIEDYGDLMDGDSLVIARIISNPIPNGTEWWGDGFRNKWDAPIEDFSGIEYFQAIPTLGVPGVKMGSNVLDLRKNTGLTWLIYWNAEIETIDISGLPGNDAGCFTIQCTAGRTPGRIIARDVKEINFAEEMYVLSYLDYRGTGVNNFDIASRMSFAVGAKVLMTKSRWEVWVRDNNPGVSKITGTANLTLELWNDEGTAVVDTQVF